MNTEGANEKEHIFGAAPERKRYQAYRDVALEMATIAVGNDDRKAAGTQPFTVAKVYNRYKALIREGLEENSPIKPLLPSDKRAAGVGRDFAALPYHIKTDNKGDSIQKPTKTNEPAPTTA
ncbi:hypothetical protein ACFWR9_41055 [Streptomyces sp. NPDC058534]|uniref:hypothetical protein n=1 Tax=Streptomyces sp. NPDC058534 TaxID=3346541 RepID=UPI003651D332